jgi:CheY-like chemotaxis protein
MFQVMRAPTVTGQCTLAVRTTSRPAVTLRACRIQVTALPIPSSPGRNITAFRLAVGCQSHEHGRGPTRSHAERLRVMQRTILVVDDEAGVQRVLARQLSHLGYEVQTADNGASALALAERSGRFDLVLSDIVMPEMNGTELAAALLERDPLQAVVLMSGYAPNGLAEVGQGMGLPVLKKPIDTVELARVLELALAPAAPLEALVGRRGEPSQRVVQQPYR